jgi:rhomboid protease GluP
MMVIPQATHAAPVTQGIQYRHAMSRRLPLHLLVLAPTLVLTVAASWYPALFISLRRDPQALLRGELWRLLSPVPIQADALRDGGWWRVVLVLLMVGIVILVGEQAFGAGRCLLLYGLGALVGHGVGALWDPYGAGCSVAGCGILGGIAGWLLRAQPLRVKVGAVFWLTLGGVATLLHDIHGPPLLVGGLAAVWLARSVPLPSQLREAASETDS